MPGRGRCARSPYRCRLRHDPRCLMVIETAGLGAAPALESDTSARRPSGTSVDPSLAVAALGAVPIASSPDLNPSGSCSSPLSSATSAVLASRSTDVSPLPRQLRRRGRCCRAGRDGRWGSLRVKLRCRSVTKVRKRSCASGSRSTHARGAALGSRCHRGDRVRYVRPDGIAVIPSALPCALTRPVLGRR